MGNYHAIQRAVRVVAHACDLPAIPTQEWANDAAKAVSAVAPGAVVCAMVAQIGRDSGEMSVISSGVGVDAQGGQPDGDGPGRVLYLQDKLERLSKLGFEIPAEAWERGLVAPLPRLGPQWQSQPLGRIITAQNLVRPLIAAVPITKSKPGFFLLLCIAFDASYPETPEQETISILAGTLPVLAGRCHTALSGVTNPKAWLTDREQEILDQLILGHSVRVIAENLGRSAHTVHDHVKNLHKKIGASSRGELIAKALGHHTEAERALPDINPVVIGGNVQVTEVKPGQNTAARPHARPLHSAATDGNPGN